ncbi:MAG: 5'-nucleotidase domain-containing protein, partial [Bacteriovoracia bacterium]
MKTNLDKNGGKTAPKPALKSAKAPTRATATAKKIPIADYHLQLNERVFVNRTLNLNSVKVIGFDQDYTLVMYNETHVEELAFQGAIDYLVDHLNYPQEIRKLKFSGERIIRGQVIDKKLGNLIKINRFGYIKAALHG